MGANDVQVVLSLHPKEVRELGDWMRRNGAEDSLLWRAGGQIKAQGHGAHLVTINPEDREQVAALVKSAWPVAYHQSEMTDSLQSALREFANPTPPKPNEPTGLGAVVWDAGTRWTLAVRIPGSFPWVGEHGGVRGWNEFSDAVEVLSEGVTS